MATVLSTGMSGTGKSILLTELGRRGHRIADIDDLGWAVEVPLPDGSGEVVPGLVELEVAVPRLRPAEW